MPDKAKWARPIDWVIWSIVLIIMIFTPVILDEILLTDYFYKEIKVRLKSEPQNVPQIIEEVNQFVNKKEKGLTLTEISIEVPAENGTFERAKTMDLNYCMVVKQMIGHRVDRIYVNVDMEKNIIEGRSRLDRIGYKDPEITDIQEINIQKLIDRVAEDIDLKSMVRDYGPMMTLEIERPYEDTMVCADVFYYTALDRYGYDENSRVSKTTEFLLKEY